MTIQQSIETTQAWTIGLRMLMGYFADPLFGSPIAFASGGHKTSTEALAITSIVEQTGRDVIYVAFGLPIEDGPIGISFATRATPRVDWHPQAQLYAACDESPIQLLTTTRRWSIGPRSILTASALPPRDRIMRGIKRANRRWGEAAAWGRGVALPGSTFIPAGSNYADALPMNALWPAS